MMMMSVGPSDQVRHRRVLEIEQGRDDVIAQLTYLLPYISAFKDTQGCTQGQNSSLYDWYTVYINMGEFSITHCNLTCKWHFPLNMQCLHNEILDLIYIFRDISQNSDRKE